LYLRKRLDAKLQQMNKKYQQQAQAITTASAVASFRKSFLKPTHHGLAAHHALGSVAYDSNGSTVVLDSKRKTKLMVNEELRSLKTRKTLFEKALRLTINESHSAGIAGVPDNHLSSAVTSSGRATSTSMQLRDPHNRAFPFKPSRPLGERSSGSRELRRLGSISTDQTDHLSISSRSTTSSVSAANTRRSNHLSHRNLYQAGIGLSDESMQGDDRSIDVSVSAGMGSYSEDFNEDEASDVFDPLLSDRSSNVQQKREEPIRKSTIYISSAVKDTVNK